MKRQMWWLCISVTVIGLCLSSNVWGTQAQDATPAADQPLMLPIDAFYDPPATIPNSPGVLLKSEPLTDRMLPANAQAWRIQYATTLPDGQPAAAVATVLAPRTLPSERLPVIAWAHGTVGILQECLPSATVVPFAGIPALDQVMAAGWVVVAADYAVNADGIHPYIIGEGEGRAVLDAVRAAHQMAELELDPRTVVWGHSQGGHSALWTGQIAADYAPEIQIAGVAAIAPATNMEHIMTLAAGSDTGDRLGSYLAAGYSVYYPDVVLDEIVTPDALAAAESMAQLCQFDPADDATMQALIDGLGETPVLMQPFPDAFSERMRQNFPTGDIAAPVLIAQGLADETIPHVVNDTYVQERCDAGQLIEYIQLPGQDHRGIVSPGSALEKPLLAWTRARFAGEPPPPGCTETTIAS